MLTSIRIRNLALVEDLTLELRGGFTVLTGETGAGKSLLVDALSLLVGARGDSEVVRQGTERAQVEGVVEGRFEEWAAFLSERGFPEEQPVVLRREVSSAGRSRAWINGSACALADLREAGRLWMRLASQHDHQSLLSEERHLALLDEVLGLDPDLTEAVQAVREADLVLKARRRSESEREARLASLEELLEGLAKLSPKPGEWTALRAEREPLRHAALLESAYREAAEALQEALPRLETAQRAMARCVTILPETQEGSDRLRSSLLEIEDLGALAQDHAMRWSRAGAERLDQVEERLAAFERLARRHRCEPDELANVQQRLLEERKALSGGAASLAELERALDKACRTYLESAEALHTQRLTGLAPLEREVHGRLARLGMGSARLQIRLEAVAEAGSPVLRGGVAVKVTATGFTGAAIWIEPNVGEGFRPLAKIASGGELSRVLLALLGAGARTGQGGLTLVLDEVDAGLGGETALAVGAALQDLAAAHQVLAVTHLAQVAARAHGHGFLSKETVDGRTRSQLAWLEGSTQHRELARLLSGHPDGKEALEHAKALVGAH